MLAGLMMDDFQLPLRALVELASAPPNVRRKKTDLAGVSSDMRPGVGLVKD